VAEITDRDYWLSVLQSLARPVLEKLANRQLRLSMPVEAIHPEERRGYTHLEAFGRLLAGIAPWLCAHGLSEPELTLQRGLVGLARESLDAATDPASADFMNFCNGQQPLVDAAFLSQAILRAPSVLWEPLGSRVKRQILEALRSSRAVDTPNRNNWVMFAAMVETALLRMGESTLEERLEGCLRLMLGWYAGDGTYGDGEFFRFDYYNSYVITPMLLDVLGALKQIDGRFGPLHATVLERARRYAEILERMIAPDGTFPCIGRSAAYRFGAFHALAQVALLHELPAGTSPAQVRCGMTAVIRKMIEAPGTFDADGWLQIGFFGHQRSVAETYISTGSLYLCSAALLPLGLPPADEFWSGNPADWSARLLWSGGELPADHAFADAAAGILDVPTMRR